MDCPEECRGGERRGLSEEKEEEGFVTARCGKRRHIDAAGGYDNGLKP
jgi:hypothetical protein